MQVTSDIQPRTHGRWLLLLFVVAISLAVVFIPAWIIQPFRPQTARGVEISYRLRVWAPTLTAFSVLVALALSLSLWNARRGIVRRIVLIALLIPSFAALWFARENHYEWMFNPLPKAKYTRASEANFLDDKDMVMAINLGNDAVAYPIRQMAYHHVVNDVVGGRPITATY